MKFTVLSRENAKRYTYEIHNHKYVIISISDLTVTMGEVVPVLRI